MSCSKLNMNLKVCCRLFTLRQEAHEYASLRAQLSKLNLLLEWMRGYDERKDALPYACHRHLFDGFDGNKTAVTAQR